MAADATTDRPGPGGERFSYPNDSRSVSLARQAVRETLAAMGLGELESSASLVATELAANAVLHTEGPLEVEVTRIEGGVRVSVYDTSPLLPVVAVTSSSSMTGRGLLLIRSQAARLGFEPTREGKVVWAEVRSDEAPDEIDVEALIDAWADDLEESAPPGPVRHGVELGNVPTHLLLEAKSHVDNLVREFVLAAAGEQSGATAAIPAHLAELIEAVVNRFSEARLSIKRQALEAARRNVSHTRLQLKLSSDAAEAGIEYLRALDEADAYCRAARLLTLESPPRHKVFRHWYVGELVTQLRRAEAGLPPLPPQPFEDRLLDEVEMVAAAQASAERAARLYRVVAALSGALTPAAVAQAVLNEGAAALGASGGGLLLAESEGRLSVPGTVGYDESLIEKLRSERATAELPAAVSLRTGDPVWLESQEERDVRFPELAGMERTTLSMCAVPLRAAGRLLGALRFSFSEQRLFDDDERRFVLALADQAAQALDRAQLYRERSEVSRRLQQGLLPPELPVIPGVDLGAAYHPFGDGVEVGGDFYDVWEVPGGARFFAVGDVSGTGPEAAAMAAVVRHSMRAITRMESDHRAVLEHLNDILHGVGDEGSERFCTVILGSVRSRDPHGLHVLISTGGHPGPVLRRAGGDVSIMATDGSLLGALASISVVTTEISLDSGDSLVFYTDGVTEARSSGAMFGDEGLLTTVRRSPRAAPDVAKALETAVLGHSGGVLHDDLAVLVIQASASATST